MIVYVVLDEKDLFQANATIIAGVLIFLTLTISFASSFGRQLDYYGIITVAMGMIPFIFSSYWLLESFQSDEHRLRLAKTCTRLGLMYLFAAILYFLFLSANIAPPATP